MDEFRRVHLSRKCLLSLMGAAAFYTSITIGKAALEKYMESTSTPQYLIDSVKERWSTYQTGGIFVGAIGGFLMEKKSKSLRKKVEKILAESYSERQ